jgi:uncharacterized repeat protein (TIGR01451 family)
VRSGIIDIAHGNAYFGSSATTPLGGSVVKVGLADFGRVGKLGLTYTVAAAPLNGNTQPQLGPPAGQVYVYAALLDSASGLAYFANENGGIFKVRLQDFTQVGHGQLSGYNVYCGVIDLANGYAYFGIDQPAPGRIAQVDIANLAVTNSVSENIASAGDVLTYTHSISNQDVYTATGLMLTSTLPVSTNFLAVSPDSPTCNQTGGRVTCALGNLPSGYEVAVTIQVQVNVSTTVALINTTRVSAENAQTHFATNPARIITFVNPFQTFLSLFAR